MSKKTNRILFQSGLGARDNFDDNLGEVPSWVSGDDVEFEFAVRNEDGSFLTASESGSFELVVRRDNFDESEPKLMTRTIGASSLNADFTASGWEQGEWLGRASWPASEAALNVPAEGFPRARFFGVNQLADLLVFFDAEGDGDFLVLQYFDFISLGLDDRNDQIDEIIQWAEGPGRDILSFHGIRVYRALYLSADAVAFETRNVAIRIVSNFENPNPLVLEGSHLTSENRLQVTVPVATEEVINAVSEDYLLYLRHTDDDGNIETYGSHRVRVRKAPHATQTFLPPDPPTAQPLTLEQADGRYSQADIANDDIDFGGQLEAPNTLPTSEDSLINRKALYENSGKALVPSAISATDSAGVNVPLIKSPIKNSYIFAHNVTSEQLFIDIEFPTSELNGFPEIAFNQFASMAFRVTLFRDNRLVRSGQIQKWIVMGSPTANRDIVRDGGSINSGTNSEFATTLVYNPENSDVNQPMRLRMTLPAHAQWRLFGAISFEHI